MYFSAEIKNNLSVSYFISKRLLKNEVQGKKVSKAIVRISVISIALAVVVNLLTIAIVTGFQKQVKEKVTGFGSHYFIMSASDGTIYESEPIHKNQAFLKTLAANSEIKNVHPVGYKPILLQSDKFESKIQIDGKDSTVTKQEIQGGLLKGVDSTFDWNFFKQHLVEGQIPNVSTKLISNELLISKRISKDLNFKVGDTIKAFFVKNMPILRLFKVVGIYETGLEDHDKKLMIGDLRQVQELNDWGIHATVDIDDTLYTEPGFEDQFIIRVNTQGGSGRLRYNWGSGFEEYSAKTYGAFEDTSYQIIVSDYWTNINGLNEQPTVPDTTYIKVHITGNKDATNNFEKDEFDEIVRHYEDTLGLKFYIEAPGKKIHFEIEPGKGSFDQYVGGFEVSITYFKDLDRIHKELKKQVGFIPTEYDETLKVSSIAQNENDIFVWLGFLDLNVWIILVLMILIGIINMGSALLVLIIVRTNFIGILKSMGATNTLIRKVFLQQAGMLILKGMLWGNILGLGMCILQSQFNIIPLNPEVYYLNTVPINLNVWMWLALNVGTLLVCVTALIIPSYVITRISPVKAVRFK